MQMTDVYLKTIEYDQELPQSQITVSQTRRKIIVYYAITLILLNKLGLNAKRACLVKWFF